MYFDKPADDHVIKTRRHFCLFSIAVGNISSFFFCDFSNKYDISDDATA